MNQRSARPAAAASEPWTPWALFGVVSAAIVAGLVLFWFIGMAGLGAMLGGFKLGAEQQAVVATERAKAAAAARPRVTTEVVTVPSKSVEVCMAEAGGQVNEHFARCRRGYSYVRTVAK